MPLMDKVEATTRKSIQAIVDKEPVSYLVGAISLIG